MTNNTQRQARVSAYLQPYIDDVLREFKDIGKVQQQVQIPRNRKLCDDLQIEIEFDSRYREGFTIQLFFPKVNR